VPACTKTYVTNVENCAATGGSEGETSAKACWDHCMSLDAFGIEWAAIVWKYGDCGCVAKPYLGKCNRGLSFQYEYHETDPTSCNKDMDEIDSSNGMLANEVPMRGAALGRNGTPKHFLASISKMNYNCDKCCNENGCCCDDEECCGDYWCCNPGYYCRDPATGDCQERKN